MAATVRHECYFSGTELPDHRQGKVDYRGLAATSFLIRVSVFRTNVSLHAEWPGFSLVLSHTYLFAHWHLCADAAEKKKILPQPGIRHITRRYRPLRQGIFPVWQTRRRTGCHR